MTSNHLTEELRHHAGADIFLGEVRGWGFGMAVDLKREDLAMVPGRFGWEGGYGNVCLNRPSRGTDRHTDDAAGMGLPGAGELLPRFLDLRLRRDRRLT
jgi:hypothetical protein